MSYFPLNIANSGTIIGKLPILNFKGALSATLIGNNDADIDLATTGVSAGTYTSLTVDSYGRVTAATNPGYITGNQSITVSGDASGSGTTAITLTLGTVNTNTGSWGSTSVVPVITVNGKGLITAVSTATITPTSIGAVASTSVGVANGVASLDSGGKVPTSQLPAAIVGSLQYQGTWNATTNTPTLTSSAGTKGYMYKVSTSGTTTLDGISQWNAGDMVVFDGTVWDKIDGISSEVLSVAGRTGAVTLTVSDVAGAAPLASPSLTGTPTAPTPTVTDNSTNIATTAFVNNQNYATVSSVPVASSSTPLMDGTAAIGSGTTWARADHVHPSDTTKANLASPAFTGTPTAPTPTATDNSTNIATTAYVKSLASSTTPNMDGAASVGSGTTWARADHTHPTDTSRAALASPTFTGVPVAPTATTNTNTTQIATTAFVIGQASATTPNMDGTAAVGTGTTFARADHVHPSDTTKANLASPTFTGTPKAPTVTVTDNSTNIATTAFVKAQSYITGNQSITVSGDISGSGTTAITATLATVNSNVGSYGSSSSVPVITVNGKGLITAVSTQSITPSSIGALALSGGTLTGNLIMSSSYKITSPTVPTVGTDVVNKTYVDNIVTNGVVWIAPLDETCLVGIASSVPSSPLDSTSYIAYGGGSYPQTWGSTSVNSCDVVLWYNSSWIVLTNLLTDTDESGVRLGVAIIDGTPNTTLTNSPLSFRKNDIIQWNIGSTDPTQSASWSFPNGRANNGAGGTYMLAGITTLVNNEPTDDHYGVTLTYNDSSNTWVQIGGPGYIQAGLGLAYAGSILNVQEGGGLTTASNNLTLNLYSGGGLLLTTDGSTSSSSTTAGLSLANSGATAGSYGNGTNIPVITVDAKGRITSISTVAQSAITGDVSISAGGTVSTLATVNSNTGSYGSTTVVPVITVNGKGLVTAVSTATVAPAWSSITSTPTTLSGYGITNAQFLNRTAVTTASYSATSTDYLLGVNYAGNVTVTLPTGTANRQFVVKDESGLAGTNNITIQGTSQNIDGSSTIIINQNYGAVTLYFNGTAWNII